MDAPPSPPPVVAVVVACDPGWWFEECLGALAAQDYPNLSVLVIDAGSAEDPTPRVAAVMPSAYVRRVAERGGFGAAANEVVGVVEGASHFLFCHDDVAPAPSGVRLLVEESFRSNAGIVTPKLVEWNAIERLLAVGASADKSGVIVPLVERGEIDQEQHDAVRDVFVAPAGCMLVRADLFATLGGFDATMARSGEDLDLSWRCQIAGGRVVVAPEAVVRHLEVTIHGLRRVDGSLAVTHAVDRRVTASRLRRLTRRRDDTIALAQPAHILALEEGREIARVRAVLKNYGLVHRLRVVPQSLAVALVEAILAVASGSARARAILRPWRLAATEGGLRTARRQVRSVRALSDHEVRGMQTRGHARLRAVARPNADRTATGPGPRDLMSVWRRGRIGASVMAITAAVLVFGTRHLLGGHMATYGEFVPIPSVGTLIGRAWSGWHATGMGSASPAPTALWLLAGAGTVVLGHVAFLQRVLVLGLIPLGAMGVWRFSRPFASGLARVVAVVLYAASPLPYDALARGHWSGLTAYATLPWILRALARETALAPFGPSGGTSGSGTGRRVQRWAVAGLPLGLLLAVSGAFVPAILPLTVAVAVALVVGSLLAGGSGPTLRAIWRAVFGVVIAGALLLPWTSSLLTRGWDGISGVSPGAGHGVSLARLLRFQTGPTGGSALGWALLGAAALPLVIGRDWRFAWAVRLWAVAVGAWGVAWAGDRGWLGFALPPREVVLSAGAVALAVAAGLGLAAFEVDLREHRFGWHQMASMMAATAAVIAVLPVFGAAFDGRWQSPGGGVESVLSWMPDKRGEGEFRVLWLGDPAVAPIAGWQLEPGVEYATSRNGLPDVTTSWPGPPGRATRLLGQVVTWARDRQTTQLGHLLAPMAVRYVVVVIRSAPSGQPGIARPAPAALSDAMQSQVDLRRVDSDPSMAVFENAAWVPGRSLLPPSSPPPQNDPAAARTAELAGSAAVALHGPDPTSASGPVGRGEVLVSEAPSSRWHLRVAGREAIRTSAFGSANAFAVNSGGRGHLAYRSPLTHAATIVGQGVVWVLLVGWMTRRRRRSSHPRPSDGRRSPDGRSASVSRLAADGPAQETPRPLPGPAQFQPAGPGGGGPLGVGR